jgi:hypothetical protein
VPPVLRVGTYSLRVLVWALLVTSFAAAITPVFSDQEDPVLVGEWSSPVEIGVSGMHAALLRTGEVLLWGWPQSGADARVLNPSTGAVADAPFPFEVDMHCAGQTVLPDGRVLLFGGSLVIEDSYEGITTMLRFDPITGTWSSGGQMTAPRWYPTSAQLPSGKTLILSGERSKQVTERTAEVYDVGAGASTRLPRSANSNSDPYAHLFVLPGGKVFRAGPNRDARNFRTATSSWSSWSANMKFGWRFGGGAVLLPDLRVLVAGGVNATQISRRKGDPATRTAEIINLTARSPVWRYTGSMKIPRAHANLVTLPDETVLAVGGTQRHTHGAAEAVHAAELFTPQTGTWRLMDSQSADRAYHSTAILLPDGRVLSAGTDRGNRPTAVDFFSPPYLFKGPRPTIDSAPSSVSPGETFEILTPDAQSISRVALIRPGATTHGWNPDQRYVQLAFTKDAGKLLATVPRSSAHLPLGYYMLFIVNDRGVPSVAPFIHVG